MNKDGKTLFRYAKNVFSSEKYIVITTGCTVYLMDRDYQILQSYKKLDHICYVEISPNEKYLLMASVINLFYVVDIDSQSMEKAWIDIPYDYNLEGAARFSTDSGHIYAICTNSKSLQSCFRVYEVGDLTSYRDYIAEKYCIFAIDIDRTGNDGAILVGLDRKTDRFYLLRYDNRGMQEYRLPLYYDDIPMSVFHHAKDHLVMIFGQSCLLLCDEQGDAYVEINNFGLTTHDEPKTCRIDDSFRGHLFALLQKLEGENETLRYFSVPRNIAFGDRQNRLYFRGKYGLYYFDLGDDSLVKISETGFFKNVEEIDENSIVLTLDSGSCLVVLS